MNLQSLPKNDVNFNITLAERKALLKLQSNNDIVIRESDKGSALVILDTDFYKNNVERCLGDESLYKNWGSQNQDRKIMAKLEKLVSEHASCLTEDETSYLTKFDYKSANFFANPKIHKSDTIKRAILTQKDEYIEIGEISDLPFRYISGGKNSPISKLAELIGILLKPFYEIIPSYIRDATDFLDKLPKLTKEEVDDILIVTCDIKDMYNNIDRELGMEALIFWLNKFPNLLHPRFNISFVTESIEFILENWTFHFNGNYFSLKKGTVTGTEVSPTYANLAMAFLEIKLYQKTKERFGEEIHNYVVKNWKRFLDDGQILWRKSFGDISLFIEILNSLHKDITFTHEISDKQLPYLNVLLYIENGRLLTDIYYKPTDCHDYLPFKSCHPGHVARNIPFTLARMIATIVDDPEKKKFRFSELSIWLIQSGYPKVLISEAISKFENMENSLLRKKKIQNAEEDEGKLIFVTTHNPQNPHVWEVVSNAFEFLTSCERLKKIFGKFKLIKSERQTKNLGRLLQKSYFNQNPPVQGTSKCKRPRCGTCPFLFETDHVSFSNTGVVYKIKNNFTCDSGYIVYKITCNHCGLYYIGQTTNLRNRVTKHKHDLKNDAYRNQKIYKHIYECAGANEIPFTITPFYHCKRTTNTAMLTIENNFIRMGAPTLNS